MPDLMTLVVIALIAAVMALAVAWVVGHSDALAKFVGLEQD